MTPRRLIEKAETLLKRETGTVFKEPGGRLNICLVYPNTYYVGMSNLGFLGIYSLLNARDDVLCERAFLPDPDDISEYEDAKAEIFAIESKRSLSRFDVVAFSISFENDYPNILKILELSKIPPVSAHRKSHHPLIIAGGVCAFSNPEPLAEFFDILFIGEAEEMLNEFIDTYKKSSNKDELLKNALNIKGLYVPAFYKVSYNASGSISVRKALQGAPERIERRYIKDISAIRLRPSITTPETEFSGMYLIEAMRGCPWNCSFCLAGHIYSPVRKKSLSALIEDIEVAKSAGAGRVGLIAPSLSDYPHIAEVLRINGVDISITSLRASPKSAGLIGLLKGKKSISIAPEAGSDRLRKAINKRITRQDIIETSRVILNSRIERLRLYFMVGLPTETEKDIEDIISLVKEIRGLSPHGEISLTLSTFVPKPFTPFQWHPMEKPDTVKARLKTIKKALLPLKGVRVFHDVVKYSYMQGFFSMADRRVSSVLLEMLKTADWQKAAKNCGIEPSFYIHRRKDLNESLPWDFIDPGVSKDLLWRQYESALSTVS